MISSISINCCINYKGLAPVLIFGMITVGMIRVIPVSAITISSDTAIYSSTAQQRVLCYMTESCQNILSDERIETLLIDGTFKTAPLPFKQVFKVFPSLSFATVIIIKIT